MKAKRLSKLTAWLLTFAMLMTFLPTAFAADGDPIEISTPEQLAEFAAAVNDGNTYEGKYIRLTGNIDLSSLCGADVGGSEVSWTPIGVESIPFKGTFDGGEYTVSGLYINDENAAEPIEYGGLFGYIGEGGTVKDLTVSGSISSYTHAGGVAAVNDGTVENCTNNVSVICSNSGGVVGTNSGTVTGCSNAGSVTGYSYGGGVVGANDGTVKDCTNTGSVTVGDSEIPGGGMMGDIGGGIVGVIMALSATATVENCSNSGPVSTADGLISNNSICATGGIIGMVANQCDVTVENCSNSGDISATCGEEGMASAAGGIIGMGTAMSAAVTVENCYNTGGVTASGGSMAYVGGIAGVNGSLEGNGTAAIQYCYSTGKVSDGTYTGGVVGVNDASVMGGGAAFPGTVTGCFYLEGSATGSVGGTDTEEAVSKTDEEFASGEVAYLLQGAQQAEEEGSEAPLVWGQNVDGEGAADAYPVLGGATVYKVLGCDGTTDAYSNTNEEKAHTLVSGVCTVCGTDTNQSGTVYNITFDWSGACDTVNTPTIDVYSKLPSDAVITQLQVAEGMGSPILSSITPVWGTNKVALQFTTKELAEPANGKVVLIVTTSNYGTFTVTINIALTGKYIVNISALPQDALYDGNAHSGYSNLSGTLTSGAAYEGTYTYTYAKADGTPLSGAPSEAGSYTVTIAVPDDDTVYKGSKTFAFDILAEYEAAYQTVENGEWVNGAFTQALANVYEGGTVKLLKDMVLTETVTVARNLTITSNDTSVPNKITSTTDQHGYLLRLNADVTLKNIIIDGGSAENITASRAMFAVGDGTNSGKLTLGEGVILRNNNNTTSNGAGGAVCVILGELTVDGAEITGNSAYSGSAIAIVDANGNVYIKSGNIHKNTATAAMFQGGGAIYASYGTVTMIGGTVKDNTANTGGAVYLATTSASFKLQNGTISGNSALHGGGICALDANLIELSGGVMTGNTATTGDAGAIYVFNATVAISGSAQVYDNTCGRNAANIFLINNPTVSIGALSDTAKVDFYSNKLPETGGELLIASPASGYTITANDLSKLSYEDKAYSLKLNDGGNVVLTDVPAVVEYTVTFSAGEGSGTMDSVTVKSGDSYTLPANSFTAPDGKEFKGWEIDGKMYAENGKIDEVKGDVTATAVWVVPAEISIQNTTLYASKAVGYQLDEKITRYWKNGDTSACTGTADDYNVKIEWSKRDEKDVATITFKGANTVENNADNFGMLVLANNTFELDIVVEEASTMNKLSVYSCDTSISGGGKLTVADPKTNSQNIYVGGNLTISGADISAESLEENAANVIYATGNLVIDDSSIEITSASDWANAAGALCAGSDVTIQNNSDVTVSVTDNNDSAAIYAGGDISISDTASVKAVSYYMGMFTWNGNIAISGNANVKASGEYALWSYNGSVAVSGGTVEAIGTNYALVNKPDLTSYANPVVFAGEDEAGAVIVSDTAGTDYHNLNKYVKIQPGYIITFDANGGTITGDTMVATDSAGKLTALPVIPTYTGYTFNGWFDAAEGGNEITADTVFNADTTVYAQWTVNPKTINTAISLTAPVANAAPQTIIDTDEYTATVVWSPEVTDKFAYSTAYTATITITPKSNYTVTGISENGYTVDGAETVTNMADSATVTVTYAETGRRPSSGGGTTRYTVKFETNGGSTIANKTVTRNSILAEPEAPTKDGYSFIGWFTDEELTTAYDFDTKVTKNFTLYAKWTENEVDNTDDKTDETDDKTDTPDTTVWENPFTDVETDDWYYENVEYAVENGLFNGTTDTTFAPNGIITRAMMVTVLYRAEGEPTVTGTATFEDVDSNAYYAKAVVWGQQNGIIKGYSETEFAPDQNITREQIAAIMFRYAQYKDVAPTGAWAIRLDYADLAEIADYATEGVMYCKLKGIMQGKDNNNFAPKDNATRAETAAILNRFIEANK